MATTRTSALLAAQTPHAEALTAGFHLALLACAIFLPAAAGIALRATNTHREPAARPNHLPTSQGPIPALERADHAPPAPASTPTMTSAATRQLEPTQS